MKKYLTIGEAAKLLGTTTFNLRYYQKEDLVTPVHMSEGGYRLYDYDDIYHLSTIKTLRDSNICIKDIKELLKDNSLTGYIKAMKESQREIEKEILRLQNLQDEVGDSINTISNFIQDRKEFTIEERSSRIFVHIKESSYEMNYSIKEVYDIYVSDKIDMSKMYKSDVHYILKDDYIILCLEDYDNNKEEYNLKTESIKEGKYLKYTFFATELELEARIEEFFSYIIKSDLSYEGELLLTAKVKTFVVGNAKCGYELQIKIK